MQLCHYILRTAEAARVVVAKQVVEKAVRIMAGRYESREAFLNDLNNNGLTENELLHTVADELAVEAVMTIVSKQADTVSEKEAKKYFRRNRTRFVEPEQRSVRHILLTVSEDGGPGNSREHARARLEAIRNRLVKNTSLFGEEAALSSECPSALNHGMLGTFPRGKLYPQLDEALFSLQEGALSEIVESEMGFHLLLCEKIVAAQEKCWEEIKGGLIRFLQKKREKKYLRQWLRKLPGASAVT